MKCNVDAVTEARVAVAAAGKVAMMGLRAQAARFGGRVGDSKPSGDRVVNSPAASAFLTKQTENLSAAIKKAIEETPEQQGFGAYMENGDLPPDNILRADPLTILQELSESTNLDKTLDWISESLPEYAEFAQFLKENMPEGYAVAITNLNEGVSGAWHPDQDLLAISPKMQEAPTHELIEVILHEATHAVIMRRKFNAGMIAGKVKLKSPPAKDSNKPEWLRGTIDAIMAVPEEELLKHTDNPAEWRQAMVGQATAQHLYDRLLDLMANDDVTAKKMAEIIRVHDARGFRSHSDAQWAINYSMSHMEELFAVAHSQPALQELLASMPDPMPYVRDNTWRRPAEPKSLFTRFKEAIMQILGIEPGKGIDAAPEAGIQSALDRVLWASDLRAGTEGFSNNRQVGDLLNSTPSLEYMDRILNDLDMENVSATDMDLLIMVAENQTEGLLDKHQELGNQFMGQLHAIREEVQAREMREELGVEAEQFVDPEWSDLSESFLEGLGDDLDKIEEMYDTTIAQISQNALPGFTQSVATRLFKSRVPLAQWAAMNLIESPMGFGGIRSRGITAPILAENWHRQHTAKLDRAWADMIDEEIKLNGTRWDQMKIRYLRHSDPNTHPVAKSLAQSVMLEMNARRLGRVSNAPAHVKAYADKLTEFNDKLYDLQLKNDVDGITGNNKRKHYMRQVWNHGKLFDILKEPGGEGKIFNLFSKAMRDSYGMSKLTADRLAYGLLETRKDLMKRRDEYRYSMEDTKDQLVDIVDKIKAKYGNEDAGKVMDALKKHDGGGAGYVETRTLDFDLETEFQGLRIMDLLDHDVTGIANVYSKEATGRAAIAKVSGGLLNSDARIDDFLVNMQKQAALNGTTVDTGSLRDALNTMMGRPVTGALPINARRIRDAVALAGMNGLGESQLAELGLTLSRGMSTLFGLQLTKGRFLSRMHKKAPYRDPTGKEMQEEELLDEMLEMTGLYSDFEEYARRNLDYDAYQGNSDRTFADKAIDTITGGKFRNYLQALQGKYTGYNAIRTMEEQIAMAGLMQDAFKAATGRKAFTTTERFKDIGLVDNNGNFKFQKYVDDGTIVVDNGRIVSLNSHKWSEEDRLEIGVALHRHAAQQVQKGFAGEASPWMQRPDVAFLMQFRSYPLLSAEKQFGRQTNFGDREAAVSIAMNAATSALARYIRYSSLALALPEDDRERYVSTRMRNNVNYDTLAYMGTPGIFMHNVGVLDALFTKGDTISQIPAVRWAENYVDATQAAGRLVFDDDSNTQRDLSNIQGAAPLGTIGHMNMIMGVIKNTIANEE